MFAIIGLDGIDVAKNGNHLGAKWLGKGNIVASYTRMGNAISAHFCSDKEGLRGVKNAINDFCVWVFDKYLWCRMVLAMITMPSVERIVKKCGFKLVAHTDEGQVYVRCKHG